MKKDWSANDDASLTGSSEDLGEEFIYDGKPRTVTFTGLTPGQPYEATFFSVGWQDGLREQTFDTAAVTSSVINQSAYGNITKASGSAAAIWRPQPPRSSR